MPVGKAISSVLKAGIEDLPDDFVAPAQSIPNVLKKQGVKDEELKFSGVKVPTEGKVTKADLQGMEQQRVDEFATFNIPTTSAETFQWVSLKPGRTNPTYREKVTTYSEQGAMPPATDEFVSESTNRYTSTHFGSVPNYLMHSRIYDDTLEGTPTRVVQEIQSDLHQAGRQAGYDSPVELSTVEMTMLERAQDGDEDALDAALGIIMKYGMDPEDPGEAVSQLLAGVGGNIPSSPFEKTWLRKGIEREIVDAAKEGRDQVAIPISGAVGDLKRAPGVQKWYDTVVLNTAKKVAKSSGMEFELKTIGQSASKAEQTALLEKSYGMLQDDLGSYGKVVEMLEPVYGARASEVADAAVNADDGRLLAEKFAKDADAVTYAVMKGTPEAANRGFSLYASPASATLVAYTMFEEGFSQDDVSEALVEQGFAPSEVGDILQSTQAVAIMKAEGYTDEEIKPLLQEQEVLVQDSQGKATTSLQPPQPNRFTGAYGEIMGSENMTMKDLLAKMNVVYPDQSAVVTNIAGFFGDEEARRVSDDAVLAQRNRIIQEANKRGLDIQYNEGSHDWVVLDENGIEQVVTPEWYFDFWEAKGEIVGGLAAGVYGLRTAKAVSNALKYTPVPGVASKAIATGAGAVTALGFSALGAAAGTELDYMHSAMVLQQDFEAQAMARKALTAAEMAVIGEVVGAGVIRVVGKSWRGMTNVVSMIRNNYLDRAGTALKETFFITDEEAADLVTKLSKVAKVTGKSDMDKAITAVATTKPGAEELVAASVHSDPRASRAVVKAIDDRAQDLLASTQQLSGENVGRLVREDLEGYTTLVKERFDIIKAKAGQAPKGNNFRFDYDKLALDPVLARLSNNIENKDVAYKFARQSQKIRDMSKSRRLGDLVDLRKMVNEFRYNKRISNTKDFEMLDGIKSKIDKAIEQGAYATMEKPQEWLTAWKDVNRQYSDMKKLEKNVLSRVLTRPGVSEQVISNALTKYAVALDSTFVDVVAKLPKDTKIRVEGAVMNNLANKYTTGAVDGVKATNFPGLAADLKDVSFSSKEARSMKEAIKTLGDVFKNDVPLSHSAGGIQVPKFAQALTTDPVAKAKFAVASEMFHYVRSLAPTASGRASALIVKTADLLESPMNSKTIAELRDMVDGQVNIEPAIENLIKQSTLEKATGGGIPRFKLYGNGSVLSAKGSGAEHSIPVNRIASTEVVNEIAEATGINLADKKALDIALRDRGYMAAQLGADKVRLLGE